uniref:Vomeronasal type-1 receptor n=2 Tax=Felis catus TaxID=9685 RepID=A0ABI8AQN2_FELCA
MIPSVSFGILGNSLLLCLYIFTSLTRHMLRPTDLILIQLVLANNLVLFHTGVPQTMAAFGLKSFLNDAGCKLVFYFHRVARGVSLSTTCLLSSFQAIKLNTNTSKWLELKVTFPKCFGFCCFLCWILHLLLNTFITLLVTGPRKNKNMSVEKIYEYRNSPIPNKFVVLLHAVMFSFIGVTCLGLMAWSSGSMVSVLLRHKQQVQHIHSNRLPPKPSHEARATHTILALVSICISFCFVSFILSLWVTLIVNPSHWLMNISALASSGFPTFSPFMLLGSDTRASQFFSASREEK